MTKASGGIEIHSPLAGWVVALESLPDAVFAGRIMGDGVAIDPVGDVLVAPCAGTLVSVHAARHAFALRTDDGVELLVHLGLDSVRLNGRGMTVLAEPGQRVEQGQPLLRFDLDTLVTGSTAAATPVIVTNGDTFAVEVLASGLIEAGTPLLRVTPREAVAAMAAAEGAVSAREIVVALPHGIHARPAARLAAAVRGLSTDPAIVVGDRRAAVASSISVLGLGIGHGDRVTIEARGPDAATVLDQLEAILTDPSEEAAPPAPPPAPVVAADGPGLRGIAAVPGLAVGRAWRFPDTAVDIDDAPLGDPATEHARFEDALTTVGRTLTEPGTVGAGSAVLAAHAAFLEDPALLGAVNDEIAAGQSAVTGWRRAIGAQAAALAASTDARVRERAQDLRDIERRLLVAMAGKTDETPTVPPGSILIATDLFPSQAIALDPAAVAGIALVEGGATAHAAIIAAGKGIPMLVGLGEPLTDVADGTDLLLDARRGTLEVDPPADRVERAREEIARGASAAAALRDAESRTADGVRIEVLANLGSVEDADVAVANGAEGCGLLRTEFLFLNRVSPPDRDEQRALYQRIADTLGDRPLTIRLLDVGGDKPAPYLGIPAEENPALGLRGVRVAIERPEVLATQLAALATVTPPRRCRIMIPMVATLAEFDAVSAMLDRVANELGLSERPALGAMVETPAAALIAPALAGRADFLSIGTNDLAQYTLAMDRGNAAVARALDGLHPAVLRLIAATAEGARAAAIPVGVCGGLAADPLAVPILIGLGVTSLSVPPALVAATKLAVSGLTISDCTALAQACLNAGSADEVRAIAGGAI